MSQQRNLYLHIIWHKVLNPYNIWPKKKKIKAILHMYMMY